MVFSNKEFRIDQKAIADQRNQEFSLDLPMATYCSGNETIRMKVIINKNVCRVNDLIEADVIINMLQSQLEIERIQLSINQDLWVKIPDGYYSKSKLFKIGKKNIPWNQFGKSGDDEYRAKLTFPLNFD